MLSPLELVTGVGSENLQEPAQYVRELLQRMKSVHDEARRHVGLVQHAQKHTDHADILYDLHLYERSYEKGDLVYQRNEAGQVGQEQKTAAHLHRASHCYPCPLLRGKPETVVCAPSR